MEICTAFPAFSVHCSSFMGALIPYSHLKQPNIFIQTDIFDTDALANRVKKIVAEMLRTGVEKNIKGDNVFRKDVKFQRFS